MCLQVVAVEPNYDSSIHSAWKHRLRSAGLLDELRVERHPAVDDHCRPGDLAFCALAAHATAPAVQLAAAKEEADEETREEELDRRRKTAASVPATEAMTREELPPARPRETKEVLEVWRRSSERAGHGGIKRSAHRGEQQD